MTITPKIPFLALLLGSLITGCGDNGNNDGDDSRPKLEYTALGASDAIGVGATPLDNGYVFLIRDALKNDGRDVELLNLGIPAAETDIIRDVELPVAINDGPELVTLFAGPNDLVAGRSVESFSSDFSEIVNKLRAETQAVIVVSNVPNLTLLPRYQDNPDADVTVERIQAYNSAIASSAAAAGVPVVDLFSEPVLDGEISEADGFHPNDAGYRRIANLFLAEIRPRLEAAGR